MNADVEIGASIIAHRGEQTQTWLADEMRKRGHNWSQSTVWAVEQGRRALRFAEALELAALLGIDLEALAPPRPVTVYEHYVTSRTVAGLAMAACGKVWNPGGDTISVGKCPTCVDLAESKWAR